MKLQAWPAQPKIRHNSLNATNIQLRYLASESTPSRRRPFLPFIPEKKNIKNKLVLSKDLRPCFVQPLSRAAWPRHHSFSLLHGSAVGPVTANPWGGCSIPSTVVCYQQWLDFRLTSLQLRSFLLEYLCQVWISRNHLRPTSTFWTPWLVDAISTKGFPGPGEWKVPFGILKQGSRNPHVNQLLFTIYGNKHPKCIDMLHILICTHELAGQKLPPTHFFITHIQSSTVSHKHDAKKMKNIILLIELTIRSLFPYVYIYTHDPFIYLSFIGLW